MTRRRLVLAAALAGAVWLVVALGADREDEPVPPAERPVRLVDADPGTLEWVEVTEPESGREARLEVDGDGELVVVRGTALSEEQRRQLRDDLTPLLAIRELPEERPEFRLAEPTVEVAVSAGGRTTRFVVGAPNFDGTATYVRAGDRVMLILPRVAAALEAVVGVTDSAQTEP